MFYLALCFNQMESMKRKDPEKLPPWYKRTGLKHVTGFLDEAAKKKLKKLATAHDKSLTRYVTRLLEKHIREMEENNSKN